MLIGKSYKFDAAHFLPNHPVCGKIHGHGYTVVIELVGVYNKETHMVKDLHDIDAVMKPLIKQLDHTMLNDTIPFPTCEDIGQWFVKKLYKSFAQSITVTVQEGNGYAKTSYGDA